jgi:DNA-binding CsgD family transcriptional regulator
MPHTVRRAGWVIIPASSAQNVAKLGAVKQGRNVVNSRTNEAGSISNWSIGGTLHEEVQRQPPTLLHVRPWISPPRHHAVTTHPPGSNSESREIRFHACLGGLATGRSQPGARLTRFWLGSGLVHLCLELLMRVAVKLRSRSVHRPLLIAAVLVGCFLWAMIVVGLSFAMVERGSRQWWVMPLFGASVLAIAVYAVWRVPATPARADVVPAPAALAGAAAVRQSAMVSAGNPMVLQAREPAAVTVRRALAEPLSPREIEVLHQLAAGRSNAEIARALFVAPGTVKAHLNHIFGKLDATSRLQAVAHAREFGLLD